MHRELKQQSLKQRKKREQERKSVRTRLKFSVSRDTGICFGISLEHVFLMVFQISQILLLQHVISITTDQYKRS